MSASNIHPETVPQNQPALENSATGESLEAPNVTFAFARLRAQVEYYFSPQNLATDSFLQSVLLHPDHTGLVPLEIIANFPKIRAHYAEGLNIKVQPLPPADPAFLAQALEGSQVVTVSADGRWISPVVSPFVIPSPAFPQQPPAMATTTGAPPPVPVEASETTRRSTVSSPSSPASQATTSSSMGIPTHPMTGKRATLVVHGLKDDFTEEQVIALLTSESPPFAPKSASREANVWIVGFESEEYAQIAIATHHNRDVEGSVLNVTFKNDPPAVPVAMQQQPPIPPQAFAPPPHFHHYPPQGPPPAVQAYPYPVMATPVPLGYAPYGTPYYGVPVVPQHVQGQPYPAQHPGMMPQHAMHYPMPPTGGYPSHIYVKGPMRPPPYYQQQQQQPHGEQRMQNKNQKTRERGERGHRKNKKGGNDGSFSSLQSEGSYDNSRNSGNRRQNFSRGSNGSLRDVNSGSFSEGSAQGQQRTYSGTNNRNRQNNKGRSQRQDANDGRRSKESPAKEILGEEHFPALGGKGGSTSSKPRTKEEPTTKVAYAAALLKPVPPPKVVPPPPSGESTAQAEIESKMSTMNVSSDTAEATTQEPANASQE